MKNYFVSGKYLKFNADKLPLQKTSKNYKPLLEFAN